MAGIAPRRRRRDRPRHHAGHQRHHRAQRRDGSASLTTAGFRDILEMGTEQRYDIYDLFLQFPEPLVPRAPPPRGRRAHRPRRRASSTPLDERQVRARGAPSSSRDGVEAVAVCFLHAYRNPVARAGASARSSARASPALPVSLSSEVVPELREYERCVTTCANAYVQPLMDRYLERLETRARRCAASRGALLPDAVRRRHRCAAATARRLPDPPPGIRARPAAASPRRSSAQLAGQTDVLSFDMGGTTAKACLIEDGRADVAPDDGGGARPSLQARARGLPIKVPVIDMIEIGAGGGSIAPVDELGLLKVGPRSAGADPGPGLLRPAAAASRP